MVEPLLLSTFVCQLCLSLTPFPTLFLFSPMPSLATPIITVSTPEDVVGAKEVKSSDEKLSEYEYAASDDEKSPKNRSLGTYYALHARYENCLVLYMMFSSRKTEPGNMWKNPTYPFLSLLSMDVCVN
ncbi:hypothetical protein ERO13_D13G139700v2 [Gossypium hirsutum]|nr:hypothetical protein ERO13_D13G139700v2 [Gossypium hirsutum]